MSDRRKSADARGRGLALGTAVAALLPGMALAGDPLTPREACAPVFSVQTRNCAVQHLFSCEGGSVFRRESWEEGEALMVEEVTAKGMVLRLWDAEDGMTIKGVEAESDAYDMTAAVAEGQDSYDVNLSFQFPIFVEPDVARVVGTRTATGESVTLDGVTFDVVEEVAQLTVKSIVMEGRGRQYVDRASGAMVDGLYTGTVFDVTTEEGGAPMKVIRPGEAGFGENTGLYDCEAVS